MKSFWTTILAGVAGGLICLGGLFIHQQFSPQTNPFFKNDSANIAQEVNFSPNTARLASPTFDFKAAAKLATPVVVHIVSFNETQSEEPNPWDYLFEGLPFPGNSSPGRGSGSGVIYSSDGYIITNNHVIEGGSRLEVTLSDNRRFSASLVGSDPRADLAVLKIDAQELPTLPISDSDKAEIGEWVLAVGNPLDLTSTVTAGIISAKGRSLELLPGHDAIEAFLQTDAAVNPGNSGGALVDANGHLLGINTAIATQTGMFQGYSFAIPVKLVTRIVDDIITYGSYQRAFLGVNIYSLNAETAEELGVTISQGVVIDELISGGSAQYAGLLPKDIIVKVNNRTINDVPELTEIVGRSKVGDVLDIIVIRRGEEVNIPVVMKPE